MAGARYTADDLDPQACRRLLPAAPVGHLAFIAGSLPRILPTPFTVRGNEVIIGSLRESAAVSPRSGEVVAFEAERYEPATREGWCVGVVGRCQVITDADEIATLNARAIAPWIPEQAGAYFAIDMAVIYGRTLTRAHPGDDPIRGTGPEPAPHPRPDPGPARARLHERLAAAEDHAAHLERALLSNRRIGMAIGIVMARHGLPEMQALARLKHQSSVRQLKLRDLAELVIYTGEL